MAGHLHHARQLSSTWEGVSPGRRPVRQDGPLCAY
jgi:hypothetical protein